MPGTALNQKKWDDASRHLQSDRKSSAPMNRRRRKSSTASSTLPLTRIRLPRISGRTTDATAQPPIGDDASGGMGHPRREPPFKFWWYTSRGTSAEAECGEVETGGGAKVAVCDGARQDTAVDTRVGSSRGGVHLRRMGADAGAGSLSLFLFCGRGSTAQVREGLSGRPSG
ncbi:hypothetical protein BKA81DRAFT_169659 [Phyllosticta paracitricarpa]